MLAALNIWGRSPQRCSLQQGLRSYSWSLRSREKLLEFQSVF